jgi:dihydroorotate dehydrogenase
MYVWLLLTGYRTLLRPVLFSQDPERIHEWTIKTLAALPKPVRAVLPLLLGKPRNPLEVAGINFPGRVGLAAGLDKDATAARVWAPLGFGFAELGTVTAQPQPGNDKPRSFRLVTSSALINRMGFNNPGAHQVAQTLAAYGMVRGSNRCPIGISIGKTKVVPLSDAVADYLVGLRTLAPYADYIAVNVSSPNTAGLRQLQQKAQLAELLAALTTEATLLSPDNPVPIFVKIAPDLSEAEIDEVVTVCEQEHVAGIIATNTTLTRPEIAPIDAAKAAESGGLSGAPLTALALALVRRITSRTQLPVLASGGIMTPADAQAMFDAGAVLLQVYTGFIFNGPAVIAGINRLSKPR